MILQTGLIGMQMLRLTVKERAGYPPHICLEIMLETLA